MKMNGIEFNQVSYEEKETRLVPELINCDQKEKIQHLKEQKNIRIVYENDRFIIYSYIVNGFEITETFTTKQLIEWSKEQLKGKLIK